MSNRVTPWTAQRPTATRPATPASRIQSIDRTTATSAMPSRCAWRPVRCDPAYSSISAVCRSVAVGRGLERSLDVEERREDALRGRRGGDAAVSAVLDHDADDELRVVARAVAAPPGLVLQA